MNLSRVLTILTGVALLVTAIGCSTNPTEVTPMVNIDATVEARAKELVAAQPTATPYPTYTPVPTASTRPTDTPANPVVYSNTVEVTSTIVPTTVPDSTSEILPTATSVPRPTITPLPRPTSTPDISTKAIVYLDKGITYVEEKKFNLAVIEFTEALKLDVQDPYIYHMRATVYQQLGRHLEALRDFNTAIELNPNLASIYNSRSETYISLGDDDQKTACSLEIEYCVIPTQTPQLTPTATPITYRPHVVTGIATINGVWEDGAVVTAWSGVTQLGYSVVSRGGRYEMEIVRPPDEVRRFWNRIDFEISGLETKDTDDLDSPGVLYWESEGVDVLNLSAWRYGGK